MALRWESQIDQVGPCYTQFSLMSVEACYLVFNNFFLPVGSTCHGNSSVTYMLRFAHASKSAELC